MKHTVTEKQFEDYILEYSIASSIGKGTNKKLIIKVDTKINQVSYIVDDSTSKTTCYILPSAIKLYNELP